MLQIYQHLRGSIDINKVKPNKNVIDVKLSSFDLLSL